MGCVCMVCHVHVHGEGVHGVSCWYSALYGYLRTGGVHTYRSIHSSTYMCEKSAISNMGSFCTAVYCCMGYAKTHNFYFNFESFLLKTEYTLKSICSKEKLSNFFIRQLKSTDSSVCIYICCSTGLDSGL